MNAILLFLCSLLSTPAPRQDPADTRPAARALLERLAELEARVLVLEGLAGVTPPDTGGEVDPVEPPAVRELLTRLEVEPPSFAPFLVQACVPVLPGDLDRPWLVQGREVQRHVVARDPRGAPTVVQVVAPVVLEDRPAAGAEVSIDLELAGDDDDPPALEGPSPFQARGRTLEGVELVLELEDRTELVAHPIGGGELRRDGPWLREVRRWDLFAARRQSLAGVHAYATFRSDRRAVELVVHVANANVLADGTGVDGRVFYRSIAIRGLPRGWQVLDQAPRASEDLAHGYLVAPLPSGQVHYLPVRGSFMRRLVLSPPDELATSRELLDRFGHGRAVGQRSYATVPAWGPTRSRLPETTDALKIGTRKGRDAARARCAGYVAELRAILASGRKLPGDVQAVTTDALGPFHPIGRTIGYEHGGWWIGAFEGYWQAREQLLLLDLWLAMDLERSPVWTADRDTGEPVSSHAFAAANAGAQPFDVHHTNNRVLGGIPFYVDNVGARWNRTELEAPYMEALERWSPHDAQHGVRSTKNARALAWGAFDAYAVDHLRALATHYEHSLTAERVTNLRYQDPSLRARLALARARPNTAAGAGVGRGEAWMVDSMVTRYALEAPDWRARALPWFQDAAAWLELEAMPSSITQRWTRGICCPSPDPWRDTGVPQDEDVAQTFETGFVGLVAFELVRSVFAGVDDAAAKRAGALCIESARSVHELAERAGTSCPPKWLLVGKRGGPPYVRLELHPWGNECLHGLFHLLFAFELSGERWFLERAAALLGQDELEDVPGYVMREASTWNDLLPHAAALVAEIQAGAGQ
jgi:hypothetical protein